MKKILLSVLFGLGVAICRAEGPYHFLKEILASGNGCGDYESADPAAHLFCVSPGAGIVVVDPTNDKILGAITDMPGVHDIVNAAAFQGFGAATFF